ncbi:MAG: hypothetical protein EBZ48_05420 [Proteobacteria bacterium]|nr:hypothetical protein [Pseudomonadota bacterium]
MRIAMTRAYHDVPGYFQQTYTASMIAEANRRLGKEISRWAAEVWERSHTDILTVPVLRGGIFFFSDLVREIAYSVELAPTTSRSYEDTENNVQRNEVTVDISVIPARGRAVLLIDDICDSGRTLAHMTEELTKVGAQEVRSAVLVKRVMEQETFTPDYIGFEYKGPEWLVGYGMDDCNRWRNLDSISVIKKG